MCVTSLKSVSNHPSQRWGVRRKPPSPEGFVRPRSPICRGASQRAWVASSTSMYVHRRAGAAPPARPVQQHAEHRRHIVRTRTRL